MTHVLRIRDLNVEFTDRGKLTNRPVRGIDLDVSAGEILGLVGETGCGKSLTGLAALGILPRGARRTGQVTIGNDPSQASSEPGGSVAIVFQNPGTAFNPVFTLGRQLSDVLSRHRQISRSEGKAEIIRHLSLVGLPDPERVYRSYPHQLSGGMLQRAMIAMALLRQPRLLILDEPTTALDVTVARQILVLIDELRHKFGFGVLLISHNLGIIRDVCDRVAVLYAGRVIETGTVDAVMNNPRHPYTRGLLGALPAGRTHGQRLTAISGTVPGNLLSITGCAFRNRCPHAVTDCSLTDPQLTETGPHQAVACIREGEL
ncbi:ABC transporter ATP-binding protein [Pseudarthrobacter sp. NIBRBAC000502772]|uniref:ABC transporter ATP-binding protein n=1 Tax=Pseudarthrobacter sp. NIBRBAC000502772 TaxID=2590775 RepID=UPI001130422E|nr:ABC transporter ATP-binding protein [Pseudarthrobacter sp. NIBRBAC000502772]QDG66729.1 ABC transporter ATP-binding protein [Pseudarthrobacter sp. NIBRBAC000502772]